ncbi:MAG: hypothetical protein M1814_002545 [Vezdaea aestivalis]|nr:MAG: hypothetical protein M1814_002545 [Vezdaea aestivalis]
MVGGQPADDVSTYIEHGAVRNYLLPSDSYDEQGTYWADMPLRQRWRFIRKYDFMEGKREVAAILGGMKSNPFSPFVRYFRNYVVPGAGLLLEGLLGLIMITASWGTSLAGWVLCYSWSLFVYGIGVGGEYPMTATAGMENSAGSGNVSPKEDRLHRGRKVTGAFLMQGWGQFFNQAVLLIVLLLANGGPNPPYEEKPTQLTFRLSFALPAIGTFVLMIHRFFGMKSASKQLDIARKKTNVTGYDRKSLMLTFRYFWHRLLATAGAWFCNDVFFYGNKLFQSNFIAVISPNNTSVVETWHYNLINVTVSLCGYYLASLLIDNKFYGRNTMQLVGFFLDFVLFIVPAYNYEYYTLPAHIKEFQVMYFLSSFFNQFGPNSVTFLVAAEIFPTPVRASAHGFAAAIGKLGALVAAVLFNYIDTRTKFLVVPWFGLAGAILTFVFLPDTTGLDLEEQERRWRLMREGRESEYHGAAVHPTHLSYYEKLTGCGKYYDPRKDLRQRCEELCTAFRKREAQKVHETTPGESHEDPGWSEEVNSYLASNIGDLSAQSSLTSSFEKHKTARSDEKLRAQAESCYSFKVATTHPLGVIWLGTTSSQESSRVTDTSSPVLPRRKLHGASVHHKGRSDDLTNNEKVLSVPEKDALHSLCVIPITSAEPSSSWPKVVQTPCQRRIAHLQRPTPVTNTKVVLETPLQGEVVSIITTSSALRTGFPMDSLKRPRSPSPTDWPQKRLVQLNEHIPSPPISQMQPAMVHRSGSDPFYPSPNITHASLLKFYDQQINPSPMTALAHLDETYTYLRTSLFQTDFPDQTSNLEIHALPPQTSFNPFTSQSPSSGGIFPLLRYHLPLAMHFRPVLMSRGVKTMERGHWEFETELWGLDEAEKVWETVRSDVTKGRWGWGVFVSRRSEEEQAGEVEDQIASDVWKVFCWGDVLGEVFVLLNLAGKGFLCDTQAKWIDDKGNIVVVMQERTGICGSPGSSE